MNVKMLFKRKYEIVDGVERFKKWKGRFAVVGTGEIPGVDSSFSSFSPTVAFSAVRMLAALTVDPHFSVGSYDLSGAFLGTELRDRAVNVQLPAEAGEYAGKVLLLLKSVYGLKTSGRKFVQQLSEQIFGLEDTRTHETWKQDLRLVKAYAAVTVRFDIAMPSAYSSGTSVGRMQG